MSAERAGQMRAQVSGQSFQAQGRVRGGDSRGCCAFRGRTSHRVGEPGGTLAGIGQEGRSQFCENPSWEGPLVNQN